MATLRVADSIAEKINHLENHNMRISHITVSWDAFDELLQDFDHPHPDFSTQEDVWHYRGHLLKRNPGMPEKTVMVTGQPRG